MTGRFRVWVDVGGTFTDCFVVTPDGTRLRGKVLSSGVSKGTLRNVPDFFHVSANPLSGLSASLPDGFWKGAVLSVLSGEDLKSLDQTKSSNVLPEDVHAKLSAVVTDFFADSTTFQLAEPLPSFVPRGQMIELNAGLEAPVLAVRQLLGIGLDQPLPPLDVRLGTTRGTNALLTRTGSPHLLITTRGFGDVLRIGSQERPELFRLNVIKHQPLTDDVIELDERLASDGSVLKPLCENQVRDLLTKSYEQGVRSIAICLLHAFQNDVHERVVQRIAQEIGFTNISVSSRLSPLIKLVSRAETTTLDAYLSPILNTYVARVWQQFGGPENARLRLMTSGGQLVSGELFRGCDSVLSGPAGGVVSLAAAGDALRQSSLQLTGVIGFDMGGTSTDVSRYEGRLVKQLESRKAGVRVMTPMMAIHTVAAGGGSICHVDQCRLLVGPPSAGSHPGPACYGNGGPLTVTDLNLVLGRIVPEHFPFKLDMDAALRQLNQLQQKLAESDIHFESPQSLAEGFLKIANNHMAEAVRTVTTSEGSDPRSLGLVSFGGAAGQHACAVAETLQMDTVIDHPDASMFSALGMGLAAVGRSVTRGVYRDSAEITESQFLQTIDQLTTGAKLELADETEPNTSIRTRTFCELRYLGTESTLTVPFTTAELSQPTHSPTLLQQIRQQFEQAHLKSFGYLRQNRKVELVTVTVEVEATTDQRLQMELPEQRTIHRSDVRQRVYISGAWHEIELFDRQQLVTGQSISGPALIAGPHNTLLLLRNWNGIVCSDGSIMIHKTPDDSRRSANNLSGEQARRNRDPEIGDSNEQEPIAQEPIELEVTARRLEGIAEQMGEILRRTSVSVNVKERLDYSCAIFNEAGYLIAGAMHVPVHLGAMGFTVRNLMKRFPQMHDGDCYASNNPYAGGSHLPDVTVVSPVFLDSTSPRPDFFVASRAHHAEIGGMTPGSMPPNATKLEEEGVVIDAFPLVRDGVSRLNELEQLLQTATYPSRNPKENIADISAQIAAGRKGAEDLRELANQQGTKRLQQRMRRLLDLSAESLSEIIADFDEQPRIFEDELIEGFPIRVAVQRVGDRLRVDFTGTAPAHAAGWNATPAIVSAALLYVLRCLTDKPLPLSEGVLDKIDLHIPNGLLNPEVKQPVGDSPAVVAGNVETSQRVVDCLLGALDVAAASQGTMNNLLIGNSSFGYYETICGGAGATESHRGADAVHTHMTNTRITDPEILETRYPIRLCRFQIRPDSGGAGRQPGGNGVIREFEFTRALIVSMLSSRRGSRGPYGLRGGAPGLPGRNILVSEAGERDLGGAFSIEVQPGQRLRVETPGGGGFASENQSV